jgi:predicted MPP superfamily phosphohydrolase
MSLFLLIYLSIYGGSHLYCLLRTKAAFKLRAGTTLLLGVFMLAMVVAPIAVRLTEKAGHERLAMVFSYIGYTWMGLLFLFFAGSLAVDSYRILIWILGRLLKKNPLKIQLHAKAAFFIPLTFSLIISLVGAFEAWDIQTERVVISSSKIPPELGIVRVVQISDVHLGLIVRQKRLHKILQAVKAAEPDLLVSTGDLVDGQVSRLNGLAEILQDIKPRYGKYAVTGNHEYYAGLDQSVAFTEKAGFSLLRNRGMTIVDGLNIAGVDDRAGKRFGNNPSMSEKDMLRSLDQKNYTLLLKHRPEVEPGSPGLFDLQLSGHTHKGQVFPFNIITWLYFPIHWGCLNPVDHCYLYVSRGSGTWGPPIRFMSPPEVTLIELMPEK